MDLVRKVRVASMIEVTIEEVQEKARLWQAQGKRWHFHMLTPDCIFSERDDKHAFVLENSTDSQTYVVYSDKPYIKVDQELVKMLHGDKILDRDKGTTDSSNERMQVILQRAQELNERSIPWHHHMLFPDCMFNEHKGKWNIVFEDKENSDVIEVLYDEEPVDDLRSIEVLYFEQIAHSFRI